MDALGWAATHAADAQTTTPQTEPSALSRKRPRAPCFAPQLVAPGQPAPEQTLRRFGHKVCQVVQNRGCTSYLEVADSLVGELLGSDKADDNEAKNIRRRVYDALNVLEALDIIKKDKKSVSWNGFPHASSATEAHFVKQQHEEDARRIEQKEAKLRALIGQQVAFRQLVRRNRQQEEARQGEGSSSDGNLQAQVAPPQAAAQPPQPPQAPQQAPSQVPQQAQRIYMPFLLAQTQTPSEVDCVMAPDQAEAVLTFANPFSVHEDTGVLRGMGLHLLHGAERAGFGESSGLSPAVLSFLHGESPWRRRETSDAPRATPPAAATPAPPGVAQPPEHAPPGITHPAAAGGNAGTPLAPRLAAP